MPHVLAVRLCFLVVLPTESQTGIAAVFHQDNLEDVFCCVGRHDIFTVGTLPLSIIKGRRKGKREGGEKGKEEEGGRK